MKNYTIKKRYLFLALFVVIIIASIFEETDINYTPPNLLKNQPTPIKITTVESPQKKESIPKEEIDPELQKINEKIAIDVIKGYFGVRDAAILKKGNNINLVIIIEYAISEERAKELGDNFVRAVKANCGDIMPGKEIGKGKYEYLIGIYYPNEKKVALGAKSSVATRIRW